MLSRLLRAASQSPWLFILGPPCTCRAVDVRLRVGELEIDRLYRRDVGLDVGGVSKQSNFGNKIALDGDTMLLTRPKGRR